MTPLPMPSRTIRRHLLLVALALIVATPLQTFAQTVIVDGHVSAPLVIDAARLATFPRRTMTVDDHGTTHRYDGVLVADLLAQAGVPLGEQLRGRALATYVLVSGRDGYRVVFSIGEMDPALSTRTIILADTIDGQPLADEQGPFRLIVGDDTRPARSVRMVSAIRIVRIDE